MAARRIALTQENRPEAADAAAHVLREGGVALLPAEGVYGLHALAADERGIARLRALKPREGSKAYVGLIARAADLDRWVSDVDPEIRALVRERWPGALTIVFRASTHVPAPLRAEDGTVALRCPGNPFLAEVVLRAGGLVVSTSANAPGEPPAARAAGPFAERVDLVVDQGALSGTPSTVVATEKNRIRVLREGAVRLT